MKKLIIIIILVGLMGAGYYLIKQSVTPVLEMRTERIAFESKWEEVAENIEELEDESILGVLSFKERVLPIRFGTDDETLNQGIGTEKIPLNQGNTVLYAHREQFFWELQYLEIGEHVKLEAKEGMYNYQVVSSEVMEAIDSRIYERKEETTLTLVTCYPFIYMSPAGGQRYVVKAELIEIS